MTRQWSFLLSRRSREQTTIFTRVVPKELFESFPFSLKLSAALLRQKIKRLVTRGKQHCLIIALVTTEKRCSRKNLRILAAKVYYCKLQTAKRTVLTTQHGIVGKQCRATGVFNNFRRPAVSHGRRKESCTRIQLPS